MAEFGPSLKRFKPNSSLQRAMLPSVNDLLEELPLGLKLRKSPSLLELLQSLSQEHAPKLPTPNNNYHSKSIVSKTPKKFKASNFRASFIKIGTWEREAKNVGDLVAKFYFERKTLVWEVLDGTIKKKFEIQWSNIVGLKASYPDDGPGTLHIVLEKPPEFFQECDPEPRKHTKWNRTTDFTGGQAIRNRQLHFLRFPQGILGKQFEKLIQCDPRLKLLSQQPDILLESPYLESEVPAFYGLSCGFHTPRNEGPACLWEVGSSSGAQSFSSNSEAQDFIQPQETLSPFSVMDTRGSSGFEEPNLLNPWDPIIVPGTQPSLSRRDQVNQIGHFSSEQMDPIFDTDMITDILYSDSPLEPVSMSRYNSFSHLLDSATGKNLEPEGDDVVDVQGHVPRIDSLTDLYLNFPSPTEGKSNNGSLIRVASTDDIDVFLDLDLPELTYLPKIPSLSSIMIN